MEPRVSYLVLRRSLVPSTYRYYPYSTRRGGSCKETIREEVVKLGVELCVYVAESMFCLCDDIPAMLEFCFKLWKFVTTHQNPVSETLLRVIHYVYSKHIKLSDGVYESVQCELISTIWTYFAEGMVFFHRLDSILNNRDCSFDDMLLPSAIAKYKQVLKKVGDKLRSVKHVSEANGFARETIESNVSGLWKSFFDEEAEIPEQVTRTRILSNLFEPFLNKLNRGEIMALSLSSPYTLGDTFAMQELKEEVVHLAGELSLLVAKSMFSLCDNIRSVLQFCFVLYRKVRRGRNRGRPVADRLLRLIYYVYLHYIKPKNQNVGKAVQWDLISMTLKYFVAGFSNLNRLVVHVGAEEVRLCREFTCRIERDVNNIEEKLRRANANGFVREEVKFIISDLWKSVYDKEAKEARHTLEEIKREIIHDMFHPIYQQGAAPP